MDVAAGAGDAGGPDLLAPRVERRAREDLVETVLRALAPATSDDDVNLRLFAQEPLENGLTDEPGDPREENAATAGRKGAEGVRHEGRLLSDRGDRRPHRSGATRRG